MTATCPSVKKNTQTVSYANELVSFDYETGNSKIVLLVGKINKMQHIRMKTSYHMQRNCTIDCVVNIYHGESVYERRLQRASHRSQIKRNLCN